MSAENKDNKKGRKPKGLALDAIVRAVGTEEPKPTDLSQYVLPPQTSEMTTTMVGEPKTEEHQQPDSQRYTHSSQTPELAAATGEKLEAEKHQQPDLPKYVLHLQTPEVVVAKKYEDVVLKEMLKTAPGLPDGMVSTAREGGDSTGTVFREFQKTTQTPKKKQDYLSG